MQLTCASPLRDLGLNTPVAFFLPSLFLLRKIDGDERPERRKLAARVGVGDVDVRCK